jgi:hypothetical protein
MNNVNMIYAYVYDNTWLGVQWDTEFYTAAFSSVGIVPGYELDGKVSIRGREVDYFSLRHSDQIGSKAC